MANPFSGIVQNFRSGARETVFPEREARRRQTEDAEAVRNTLLQNPNLPPVVQQLAQDPEAFAAAMRNPQALTQIGQGAAALDPQPKPQEGDDILTLFDRAAQFEQAGDTRRAELLSAAAAKKAGIDLNAGNSGPFGSGLKGSSFNLVNQLAPGALEGQLSDDQGRLLDTALAQVLQPVPYQDPVTRETLFIKPTLPPFVRQLAQQRGIAAGGAPGGAGALTAPPVAGGQPEPAPAPGVDPAAAEGAESGAAPPENVFAALPSGSSIFDQAPNLTGPVDTVVRKLSGITGLGGLTGEQVGAERLAANVTELLVDAMRTEREGSSRAIAEVEDLRKRFGFTAETFGSTENLRERAAQARIELERRENEILQRGASRGRTSGEQKKRDLDALVRIQSVKDRISPPVLQSAQEIQDFIANSDPGTEFLMRDPDDPKHPWIKVRVKGSP